MQKIERWIFEFIYHFILILAIVSIFIYDKSFFLGLTVSGQVLQLKHQIILYGFRIILSIIIFFFIFNKNLIKEKRKEILLLLITLFIVFLGLELVVRFMVCTNKIPLQIDGQCGKQSIYSPHHYINYYGTPNYQSYDELNTHNSLGFRGPEIQVPKPSETYRIITIGGSTTYGAKVKSWKDDFARQLESNLRDRYRISDIEVINAGMGSWNTWESLINFEFKVLDLEPDMIIIYHAVNDVTARIVNNNVYVSDNSGLRKQWRNPEVELIFHSALFRFLSDYKVNLIDYIDASTANEGMRYTGFTEKLNNTPVGVLEVNEPIYYERNLRSMIAIAKEYNITILIASFAMSEMVGDHARIPQLNQGVEEHNKIIERLAEQKNISFYDFASTMPKDAKYWADGIHLTEEGNKLKAELFSEHIESEDLIPIIKENFINESF